MMLSFKPFSLFVLICLILVDGNAAHPALVGHRRESEMESKEQEEPPSNAHLWWVNPCGFSLDEDGVFPQVNSIELIKGILVRSRRATNNANQVKDSYFTNAFNDKDFEREAALLHVFWLPEVVASRNDVSGKTAKYVFDKAYTFLQYFAVVLEQMIKEQMEEEGHAFLSKFQTMKQDLVQLLCEVQLGHGHRPRSIGLDAHVFSTMMSDVFDGTTRESLRRQRDYIILRDYVKALRFITKWLQSFI